MNNNIFNTIGKSTFMMTVKYFYEVDCFNLNRKARLYYPFPYQLAYFLRKFFYSGQDNQSANDLGKKEIIKNIQAKLDTVKETTNWEQSLLNASFVVFDSETTGLQPFGGDRIISLSGVIVEEGVIKTEAIFDELINPLRSIPPRSTDITGITNAMISGRPTLFQVLPEFLNFIGSRILVAHCASFDLAFLNLELGQYLASRIMNPVIDTRLVAQKILPHMNSYSLDSLLKSFNLEIKGRHTSRGDALMTAQLFIKLLEILEEKGIYTLNQLSHFLSASQTHESYLKWRGQL
jgi:DNA polymerase-3 subunit epsilon